jgi:hypothetical protein
VNNSLHVYEADSVPVLWTVTDEATEAPLATAEVSWVGYAQRRGSNVAIPASITVIGPGELLVRFEPETFTPAIYEIQVRGTRGDDVQTLIPPLRVTASRSIQPE